MPPANARQVQMVTWLRELASAASVEIGADQDAEVAVVDAGDGVAEAGSDGAVMSLLRLLPAACDLLGRSG